VEDIIDKIQKREKLVTNLIIMISIIIGVLMTIVMTGLLEFIY